jgi:hypothetical protein
LFSLLTISESHIFQNDCQSNINQSFISDGDVFPFRDLRRRSGFKYFKFLDPIQKVNSGVDSETCNYSMGEMEIQDVYEEKYLVVHSLFMENLMMEFSSSASSGRQEPAGEMTQQIFKTLNVDFIFCFDLKCMNLILVEDYLNYWTIQCGCDM